MRDRRSKWKYLSEPIPDWIKGTMEERFSAIFQRRFWEDQESISGPGSSLAQAKTLIAELPRIWAELGVRSMIDVPCGDFNWMSAVDLQNVDYLGADIVSQLVAENQSRYGSERVRFVVLDITAQSIPSADLILCRDGLVHLSHADVWKGLANFLASGCRYLMATTFPGHDENHDIESGDWRPLNLERPPFEFPAPLRVLVEGCPEEGYEDKSLALWDLGDLRAVCERNRPRV